MGIGGGGTFMDLDEAVSFMPWSERWIFISPVLEFGEDKARNGKDN